LLVVSTDLYYLVFITVTIEQGEGIVH